jgi:8-oxo-dGTP diphosphatase
MPKPDDVGVGTALLVLNEEGQILLHLRKGAHRAGHWSCPGGWLDRADAETKFAVIRETREESGLTVLGAEHFCWVTEDHPTIGVRTVTLYHIARHGQWEGEPQVLEPTKCERWEWFDLDNLPAPLFPGLGGVLERLRSTR